MQITSSNISSTSDTQDSPSATEGNEKGNEGKILSAGVAKISFSVSKRETTKIVVHNKFSGGKAQNEDDQEIEESRKRGISHFEDGQIIDSAPERKKEKKVFVIPVLQLSNQAQIERLSKLISDGNATEHDKARLALLTESSGGGRIEQTQTLGQQKWQFGLSTMPTTVEPDEADPDYETMPVGEFGLAFLRGCGWKDEGSAIGKTNPQAVPLRLTKPRPKGLGLGAILPDEPPPDKKKGTPASAANGYTQQQEEDGQKKELSKNSFAKCLGGLYKGQCGKVLSMDEENSSVFLELTWPSNKAGRTVRVSQFAIEVMSKAEYRAKMDGGGKEKERSRNGKAIERRMEK